MDLYKQLFDHMSEEHGVLLLEMEMDEIIRIVTESLKINIPKDYKLFRLVKTEERLPTIQSKYATNIGTLLFVPEGKLWFSSINDKHMLQVSPFEQITYWMEPVPDA